MVRVNDPKILVYAWYRKHRWMFKKHLREWDQWWNPVEVDADPAMLDHAVVVN